MLEKVPTNLDAAHGTTSTGFLGSPGNEPGSSGGAASRADVTPHSHAKPRPVGCHHLDGRVHLALDPLDLYEYTVATVVAEHRTQRSDLGVGEVDLLGAIKTAGSGQPLGK